MILLIVALIVLVGSSLLENNGEYKIMNEFCNLECQERKIKKHNFCC